MLLAVTVVLAANNGKSNHLNLVAKNPSDWTVVPGMSGKLNYGTNAFVFNGQGLTVGTDYSLISYKEPWPGTDSVLLGTGVADAYGDVHIMGAMTTVCNAYGDSTGAKIWLVPTGDMSGGSFIAWNPTQYLFESNLIATGCSVA
jgi:hypothetical protein